MVYITSLSERPDVRYRCAKLQPRSGPHKTTATEVTLPAGVSLAELQRV